MAKQKTRSKKRTGKKRTPAPLSSTTKTLLWGVLAITALVFANSIQNGFVNWDDPNNVYENPFLNGFTFENIKSIFTSTVIGNYNPLTIFSFAIENAIFGMNTTVFHLNNLLLHLVCVYLVYRLLTELKLSPLAAAVGALLFGIHPMRVESVAWITERKDVLFGAFYLGALLMYIKSLKKPEQSRKYLLYTFLLFILSCLSKIQAVSLPLSMLAIDYYFKKPLKFKLLLEKIPFFGISLLTGLAGVYFLGTEGSLENTPDFSLPERLMTGAYSYCIYLIKLIFPYEMSPLYPYELNLPKLIYVAPIGVLAVAFIFYRAFKASNRPVVFAIAFFTFNVMFVLQIIGAGQGYLADRFTYIPYLGFFFLAAFYFDHFLKNSPQKKQLIFGISGVFFLLYAFMTFNQNKIWKNGGTLWTHVIKCYPNVHTGYQNRGKFYEESGNIPKALSDMNKAIEVSYKKDLSYNSRGKLYFDRGEYEKAFVDFDAAVKAGAKKGEIFINRGSTHLIAGRKEQALQDFNKGIELDPAFRNGYLNRSVWYQQANQLQLAINDLKKAAELQPNDAKVYYEIGKCNNILGKPAEALKALNDAIRFNASVGLYYTERAKSHTALGNTAAAQQDQNSATQNGG